MFVLLWTERLFINLLLIVMIFMLGSWLKLEIFTSLRKPSQSLSNSLILYWMLLCLTRTMSMKRTMHLKLCPRSNNTSVLLLLTRWVYFCISVMFHRDFTLFYNTDLENRNQTTWRHVGRYLFVLDIQEPCCMDP